jgi:transcriptional regulator with XRE-family HTH domain
MSLPTTSSDVGRAIRATRERSALSLERVARASGVPASELRAIEAGRARPSIAALGRIARALGADLVDLVRGTDSGVARRSGEPGMPGSPPLGLPQIARAIADLPASVGSKVDAAESAAVLYAMKACDDNQSAAARLLGMERKAFVRRLVRSRRRKPKK